MHAPGTLSRSLLLRTSFPQALAARLSCPPADLFNFASEHAFAYAFYHISLFETFLTFVDKLMVDSGPDGCVTALRSQGRNVAKQVCSGCGVGMGYIVHKMSSTGIEFRKSRQIGKGPSRLARRGARRARASVIVGVLVGRPR